MEGIIIDIWIKRRKLLGKIFIGVIALMIVAIWTKMFYVDFLNKFTPPHPLEHKRIPKIQLVDYRTKENRQSVLLPNCPYKCEISYGIDNFQDKDAVVFHAPSIGENMNPPKKANGQIWVFLSQEASLNHLSKFHKWNGLFNWTMTQRHNSDSLIPDGSFIPRNASDPPTKNISGLWENKTEQVAWMVGNCKTQSKREKYVKQMKKYIDVHVYGGCGNRRSKDRPASYRLLTNKYKFYISFENTLCFGYFSEKTFKLFIHGAKVIPLVRDPDKKFNRLLPPKSFINTADFSSAKEFASYLKQVSSNKTAYEEYFEWEKHYKLGSNYLQSTCKLCEMIYNKDKYKRLYGSISDWLLGGSYKPNCYPPTDI